MGRRRRSLIGKSSNVPDADLSTKADSSEAPPVDGSVRRASESDAALGMLKATEYSEPDDDDAIEDTPTEAVEIGSSVGDVIASDETPTPNWSTNEASVEEQDTEVTSAVDLLGGTSMPAVENLGLQSGKTLVPTMESDEDLDLFSDNSVPYITPTMAEPTYDDQPDYLDDSASPDEDKAHGFRFGEAPAPMVQDPIAAALYGRDDFDVAPPPTEEVPAGVMEDLAQPYTAPMSVPEPPPISGIIDRYTPAPASRTPYGSPHMDKRPSYFADDVEDERVKLPETPAVTMPPPEPANDRTSLFMGIIGLMAFVMIGLACALGSLLMNQGGAGPESLTPTTEKHDGVPVRGDVHKERTPFGEVPEPDVPEPVVDEADPADAAENVVPVVPPVDAKPVPKTQPKPTKPVKPTQTAPKPKDKAPAASDVAKKGSLKVRANRRVLIRLDGKPLSYAPVSRKITPGPHKVEAMIPGDPSSLQSKSINVGAGQTKSVDFTF